MNFSSLNIRTEREKNSALITQLNEAQARLDENFQKACLELLKKTQTAIEKLPNALKVEFEVLNNNQTLFIKKRYVGVEIRLQDNATFFVSSFRARPEGKGKHARAVFYHVHSVPEGVPVWENTAPAEELVKYLPSIMEYIRSYWQKPITDEQIRIMEEYVL